jgi:hypothetical protein
MSNVQVKVPTSGPEYSWNPGPHYLVDDDDNVVGVIPATKEVPISQQEFTKVSNIRIYSHIEEMRR